MQREYPPARLFTPRLWQAAAPDDPVALEWRGKLQSLPDGEAYFFRDWPGLIRHLEATLETKPSSTWSRPLSLTGKQIA